MGNKRLGWTGARAFLVSLARDARANTLAIMAIALIPLAGMVGGGVDISRMYIVKTRLQHACDAGALAGRKTMGGGTWGDTPRQTAEKFFDANYNKNAYGVNPATVGKAFTEQAGKVSGTAQATVPMTLMRIFGKTSETLSVTCDADMRLPNTDVMFVLDTTGSMGSIPSGDTQSKLASLKVAVKCFYEIVAKLDTNATCTTGAPSGGTGNQVQIRFGFVPYATNVNVGRLLKTDWFADSWLYQTRTRTGSSWSNWTNDYYTSKTNGNCVAPANTSTQEFRSSVTGWGGSYACRVEERHQVPVWKYDQLPVNVGLLKNGSTWNANFQWPINDDGSNRTINWDGCIEERTPTVSQSSYDPIPSGAKDLDIDLMPSQGDASTLWAPALDDVIFTREDSNGNWTRSAVTNTMTNFGNESSYFCPTQAKKLQTWSDPNAFDTYVDSLVASGNTYHDIGLLWGGRLASPTGIFGSENALTPQGGEIERHLIFMTDGDPCTDPRNYQAYGVGWYDRRETGSATLSRSQNCTEGAPITDQVNARTQAICKAIRNKNITLWVITFGDMDSRTITRMTSCATPGRYFHATNAQEIQETFKSIADQISQLRLTK